MRDFEIRFAKLKDFLAEDLGFGDVTSESIINEGSLAEGEMICRSEGIVAGLEEARRLFSMLGCRVQSLVRDGEQVKVGSKVLKIEGSARSILKCERMALNILMRMSGIATETHRLVDAARRVDPGIRLACTRKTAPGLREFDKRAVALGGGDTHRLRLDDMVMIKDNHLALIGSVKKAVKRAKANVSFTKKIEVEVTSLQGALEAAEAGADVVMLDNMEPAKIKKVILALRKKGFRQEITIEASGKIDLASIEAYAETGVDIISVGYITHSPRALDFSLEIKASREKDRKLV